MTSKKTRMVRTKHFAPVLMLLCCVPLLANRAVADPASPLPQAACVGWNKVATLTLRGQIEDEGFKGSFTKTLDTRSGRYTASSNFGMYTVADGFDGMLDWTQDWSSASHYLNSRTAHSISITDAWLRRRGWCQSNSEQTQISALPDRMNGNTAETIWRVTPMNGIDAILRFDRNTGLLRSSEIRMQLNLYLRRYDNWKDIGGGVLVPFTEKDGDPDEDVTQTITVTAAKYEVLQRPAGIFTKPPESHDYAILGGAQAAIIPYEDGGRGRIYVQVLIDGEGPFPFEVDTGGHLIITPETAAKVHLSPVGNISNSGAGPAVDRSGLVRTREIRIGNAVMFKQIANVLSLSKIGNDRGRLPPRAGVLGLELFERFAVELNRTAKTLTLTPLDKFKGVKAAHMIPIHFTEDFPEVVATFNGVSGDFMLDTGDAAPATIYGYWAQEHGLADTLSHGIQWSGVGVGGEFPVLLSRGDLTLGPLSLPHEVVRYTGVGEHGDSSTRSLAGIIGESSLYRFNMTYDYRHQVVWIDPAPKAPERAYNRAGLDLKRDSAGLFEITIVAPNSAGAAAGLRIGDRITAINSQPVSQLAPSDALVIFSGPIGSIIDLQVNPKDGSVARSVDFQLEELLP